MSLDPDPADTCTCEGCGCPTEDFDSSPFSDGYSLTAKGEWINGKLVESKIKGKRADLFKLCVQYEKMVMGTPAMSDLLSAVLSRLSEHFPTHQFSFGDFEHTSESSPPHLPMLVDDTPAFAWDVETAYENTVLIASITPEELGDRVAEAIRPLIAAMDEADEQLLNANEAPNA